MQKAVGFSVVLYEALNDALIQQGEGLYAACKDLAAKLEGQGKEQSKDLTGCIAATVEGYQEAVQSLHDTVAKEQAKQSEAQGKATADLAKRLEDARQGLAKAIAEGSEDVDNAYRQLEQIAEAVNALQDALTSQGDTLNHRIDIVALHGDTERGAVKKELLAALGELAERTSKQIRPLAQRVDKLAKRKIPEAINGKDANLTPRGEWAPLTLYIMGDVVRWYNATYIACRDNRGSEPHEHSHVWQLVAKDGEKGRAIAGGGAATAEQSCYKADLSNLETTVTAAEHGLTEIKAVEVINSNGRSVGVAWQIVGDDIVFKSNCPMDGLTAILR